MIRLDMVFGPPLLLAGLAFRRDRREAALPLVAGILLIAAWAIGLSLPGSAPAALVWMIAPGVAGVLVLVQAVRTDLGGVAQGVYAAGGLLCLVPILIFAVMFYALSGDV